MTGTRALCVHPEHPIVDLHKSPKPQGNPEAGAVLVRITARPIHALDLSVIRKKFIIPGSPTNVGEGVSSVKRGDRVIPLLFWSYFIRKGAGSWQDYVEVREEEVILVPEEMHDDTAAQFVSNPWTAYCILQDLGVASEDYILQNCAGSVVGRLIIQIAKHWGLKTISLVRRDELKEELSAIGADVVINTTKEGIDMLGGYSTKLAAANVRSGGKLVTIGTLESTDLVISFNDMWRNIHHNIWGLINFQGDKHKVAEEVMQLFKQGIIETPGCRRFEFEEYHKAIEESERVASGGKVLLV
ncbi:enoyl-[acyl-carrier-protein] reductase, mitochondrial [Selaginella moellendorffii]|uniref:enoyl-[acyl-carrier-protein] reductase, mitochondrial n=1 Tax=Selaginella moellendorffii TaxID=88036 RepID=UPI000D1C7A0C|nr:enoyl-[acyl-carrier-protein] reductase, mitochondrial [Selaginella moellendorffii]|eukprot:XP_024543355.1 enoyl-[acyl-carrier-protein] reductase, mitochondrial [Selaginella moellendorffii]